MTAGPGTDPEIEVGDVNYEEGLGVLMEAGEGEASGSGF